MTDVRLETGLPSSDLHTCASNHDRILLSIPTSRYRATASLIKRVEAGVKSMTFGDYLDSSKDQLGDQGQKRGTEPRSKKRRGVGWQG
ncbi:hypothetical protein ASPCAL01524 [Aspergillus calidoustus]|uniref:Uncharacterized protein n=1 Tax=Aspergillus calidoustus TaxID=454130 RepID=A0A0U5C328_ASPCI|nr:hypothetical protein ASPCAL01524 [Aspergillus calidoustus]